MQIQVTDIKLDKAKYIPDRYILPEVYDNISYHNFNIIDPFFYVSTFDFDGRNIHDYEVYTYQLLKTCQHFFTSSSNVVEIGSDYGITAKRYSEYAYHVYTFENDEVARTLLKHNVQGINNIHVFSLTEGKQLQRIDTEFLIVRDESLFAKYFDIILEKQPTILLKSSMYDMSTIRMYGYELYKLGVYCLCVPFYFNKPIYLPKYE